MIADRTRDLEKFCQDYLGNEPKPSSAAAPGANWYAPSGSGPSDADVVEKLMSERTDKGCRLLKGDTTAYQSDSEADLALLEKLAFYTQDAEQLERIWCDSGLYREKLERADYRWRTIAKALDQVAETYPWNQRTVPGDFQGTPTVMRGCASDGSNRSDRFSKGSPMKNVPDFSTDALPSKVARYVEEAALALSCPPDMVAIPTIAVLSGVMGRTREVRVKRGWTVSGSLYLAMVASAGEKSRPRKPQRSSRRRSFRAFSARLTRKRRRPTRRIRASMR